MKAPLIIILSLFAGIAFGQTTQELEVKGQGQLKSQPDLGVISISVTTVQKDFVTALSTLTSHTEKLVAHLEKTGYKRNEIKTTNFEVNANTEWRDGNRYDSGFLGKQYLSVEFQNTRENIAKLIDAFKESPVEAQVSFHFTVSDALKDKLKNELIKKAIDDGKRKAKLIADACGQQLVKIKTIKYGTFSIDYYADEFAEVDLSMDLSIAHQGSPRSMGFAVEEMTFNDYVIIVYEIK